jgi:hypothetical protein
VTPHGTAVDRYITEEPHRITLDAIDRVRSSELRRIMIERYRAADETHGHSAYLRDAGGVRLDDDPAFGTLWRRAARGDEPLMMVEVVNHTPEPDGSTSTTSCASIRNCGRSGRRGVSARRSR